jgi:hypothetical protein
MVFQTASGFRAAAERARPSENNLRYSVVAVPPCGMGGKRLPEGCHYAIKAVAAF